MEDVEEEEDVQDMVEEEVVQSRNGVLKDIKVASGVIPILFLYFVRKFRKQMLFDFKMVEIFNKVEVIIFPFDGIYQVS
ncbi:hypothetical protein DF186_13940, partial [Enterococcus hirae]